MIALIRRRSPAPLRFVVASVLLAAGLTAAAAPAEACSPAAGVTSTIPAADATTYPANAPIYFYGYYLALTPSVAVTVDGQPASLVDVSDQTPHVFTPSFAGGVTSLRVRIDPPPSPGQEVSLSGNLCQSAPSCDPVLLQFTAAAPDEQGPATPPGLTFDLHDHGDSLAATTCDESGDFAWWLRIQGLPATAAGESPVFYDITAFTDETLSTRVAQWSRFAEPGDVDVRLVGTADLVVGAPLPEAACFRIDLADLAGNPGASSNVACAPCLYRADPPSSKDPAEPSWTSADVYPGGFCGDRQVPPAGSGDPESASGGCQLAAAPGVARGGLLAALPLFLLPLARRRAARRRA